MHSLQPLTINEGMYFSPVEQYTSAGFTKIIPPYSLCFSFYFICDVIISPRPKVILLPFVKIVHYLLLSYYYCVANEAKKRFYRSWRVIALFLFTLLIFTRAV